MWVKQDGSYYYVFLVTFQRKGEEAVLHVMEDTGTPGASCVERVLITDDMKNIKAIKKHLEGLCVIEIAE